MQKFFCVLAIAVFCGLLSCFMVANTATAATVSHLKIITAPANRGAWSHLNHNYRGSAG